MAYAHLHCAGEVLPADIQTALEQLRTDAAQKERNPAPGSRSDEQPQEGIGAEAASPQNHSTGNSILSTTEGTAAVSNLEEYSQNGAVESTLENFSEAVPFSTSPGARNRLSTGLPEVPSQMELSGKADKLVGPASHSKDTAGSILQNGSRDVADKLARDGANNLARDGADSLGRGGADSLTTDGIDSLARGGADSLARDGADSLDRGGLDSLATDKANDLAEAPSGCKPGNEVAAIQASILAEAAMLPERAEILVTDLFDHR